MTNPVTRALLGDMIALTKSAVKTALGIRSDADLARFFSTSRQSVCKWRDDEPIPVQRQWQLRAMRPALFRTRTPKQKAA